MNASTLKRRSKFLEPVNYRIMGLLLLRKILRKRQLVILGSAHKTGSTWLGDLVKDICALRQMSLQPDIDLTEFLEKKKIPYGCFFYKSHSLPPPIAFVNKYEWVKFLTIIRDPRDVVVSASFYLANIPQEHGGWDDAYRRLDDVGRIQRLIEEGEFLIVRMRDWFNCPYSYKVRYENLITNGIEELAGVVDYLGYSYSSQTIGHYYQALSFKKVGGRERGIEDRKSFYRKGVAGDWRNKFNEACVHAFKSSRQGEWQDLLIELGYEDDADW